MSFSYCSIYSRLLPFLLFRSELRHVRYENIFFRLGLVETIGTDDSIRPVEIKCEKSCSRRWANGPRKCSNIWIHAPLCRSATFRTSIVIIHSGSFINRRTSSRNWVLHFGQKNVIYDMLGGVDFYRFIKMPEYIYLHSKFRRFLNVHIFDYVVVRLNISTSKSFVGKIWTKYHNRTAHRTLVTF